MTSPKIWATGRYDAVGEHIATIAAQVIGAVEQRRPLRDASLVDIACGTGNATLAAAARGARVTAVDFTPELVAIGARRAEAAGINVRWVTADASDTGLPGEAFDVAVSNMGIIYIEPVSLTAEIGRLLRSGGTVGFSSWVHDPENPFYTPILEVLGPQPEPEYSPDQWGDPETIATRLAPAFDGIGIEHGTYTWQFESVDAVMQLLTRESPQHLDLFSRVDDSQRGRLLDAFDAAMRARAGTDGRVAFRSPYVVVTAQRR